MKQEEIARRLDKMQAAQAERDADGSVTFDGDPQWDALMRDMAAEAVADAAKQPA